MKHRVIALGRQFGSGGREIAKKLAQRLELPCYDRELISLAAQRAEVDENLFQGKDEKAANRWLYTAVYEGGPRVRRGQPAEDILFQMQSQVILELAQREDCIIVGRCADFVLEPADTLVCSLFLCAPFPWRVRRRVELEGVSEKQAADEIARIDRQRERYYNTYTQRRWSAPENYDLCINSSVLGIDGTVDALARHLNGRAFR